jgi:TPR repeat protein
MMSLLLRILMVLFFSTPVLAETNQDREYACSYGIAVSCYILGQSLSADHETQVEAMVAFSQACELGLDFACHDLAVLQLASGPGPDAEKTAAQHLMRTCRSGIAESCTALGYNIRASGAEGELAALELFTRACDLGANDACLEVGKSYSGVVVGSQP